METQRVECVKETQRIMNVVKRNNRNMNKRRANTWTAAGHETRLICQDKRSPYAGRVLKRPSIVGSRLGEEKLGQNPY